MEPRGARVRLGPLSLDDLPALFALMVTTIRRIGVRDYSPEQVSAWAGEEGTPLQREKEVRFQRSLLNSVALVAEIDGKPAGFGNVTADGFIDYLYVHHAHQGEGVASRLLLGLEEAARAQGARRLTTHASRTLRPLLVRRGFCVVEWQTVVVAGVAMENVHMEKTLQPGRPEVGC